MSYMLALCCALRFISRLLPIPLFLCIMLFCMLLHNETITNTTAIARYSYKFIGPVYLWCFGTTTIARMMSDTCEMSTWNRLQCIKCSSDCIRLLIIMSAHERCFRSKKYLPDQSLWSRSKCTHKCADACSSIAFDVHSMWRNVRLSANLIQNWYDKNDISMIQQKLCLVFVGLENNNQNTNHIINSQHKIAL